METLLSQLPDSRALNAALTAILRRQDRARGQLTILEREPNIYTSSFPSERVVCRFEDGSELQLFCKYGVDYNESGHGTRGGVPYEAEVYRHVLQPLSTTTPIFYGSHTEVATGETWLFLKYTNGMRLPKVPGLSWLSTAARWIGQFHAVNQARLQDESLSMLKRYDADYYAGWLRRTSLFAGPLHQKFPWLEVLCDKEDEIVSALLVLPPTVIHGEYTPHNVLIHNGAMCPVDWESAAVGVGELDLVTLTDKWPAEIVQACELEYQRARYPAGAPADFTQLLALIRLLLHFRWLGDRSDWTADEDRRWRFDELRAAGEQLGFI